MYDEGCTGKDVHYVCTMRVAQARMCIMYEEACADAKFTMCIWKGKHVTSFTFIYRFSQSHGQKCLAFKYKVCIVHDQMGVVCSTGIIL